jgi:hypothetical protein
MIEFAMEIDAKSTRLRKEYNKLLIHYGLDFEKPPASSFHRVAYLPSNVTLCRTVNTVHMLRISCLDIAQKYASISVESLSAKGVHNQAAIDAWADFQTALETTTRSEADLILACIPPYITPGQAPLNPATVVPLVWPLSSVGSSQQVTLAQRERARAALLQIGTRAMIPIAVKMANVPLDQAAELSKEVQLLHLAWHL